MARETFVYRDGEVIPKREAYQRAAGPYVISDHLDGTASPITGKMFDSKSAYYRHVRENGCEIVGNDPAGYTPPPEREMGDPRRDIARAIEQLRG